MANITLDRSACALQTGASKRSAHPARASARGLLHASLALLAALLLVGTARAMPPPELKIWWMQAMPNGDLFVETTGGGVFYTDNAGREWVWLSSFYMPDSFDNPARFEFSESMAAESDDHLRIAFSLAHAWPPSEMRNAPVRSAGNTHLACHDNRIIARRQHASTWTVVASLGRAGGCTQMLADGDALLAVAGEKLFRSDLKGRIWTPVPAPRDGRGRTFDFLFALPGQGIFANMTDRASPGRNGFARSTDGGLHWFITDFPQWAFEARLAGGAHGVLYAVLDDALIESRDAGASWRAHNPRLRRNACTKDDADAIKSVQGGPNGELYVVTGAAIYRRLRAGAGWTALPLGGVTLDVKPRCRVDQLL